MLKPSNYPFVFIIKLVLIFIFANVYYILYRDTNLSFKRDDVGNRVTADSAELNGKIHSDSLILLSYLQYRDTLKVQKSVLDNVFNKLKNTNSATFPKTLLERPEHHSVALVRPLSCRMMFGDTIAEIRDSQSKSSSYLRFRETRQTFTLGYDYKHTPILDLPAALSRTKDAVDYDRDLCNRVIQNAEREIGMRQRIMNNTLRVSPASKSEFWVFAASLEFTFSYTNISPESTALFWICIIHKMTAFVFYFILGNQLKKKYFP